MRKNKLAIYATDEFLKDFKKLLSLNISQLKGFNATFKKDDNINFEDDKIEKYINEFKIDINTLSSISSVIKYIRKFILENSLSSVEIKEEIKNLADKVEIKISSNKLNILSDILKVSKTTIEEYADSPFLNSVIPNLSYITALFDLRTVYKENNSKEIKYLKPISIIRIGTVDDKDNKDNFRFQIDLQGLNKLIEFFEKYKEKLEQLDVLSKRIEK